MKKLLSSPLFISLCVLLSGAGAGVYWFWRASDLLVAQALAARQKEAPPDVGRDKGWDFWTIEIENLASELRDERAHLRNEAEQIDQRKARLATEQQQLTALRSQIEQMQKEITERVVEIRADEKKNIRSLAQTYTSLTPRAAVALIHELDDVTVVKILSQMKPDVIGPIFEEMTRESTTDDNLSLRAATLSEKIRLVRSATASK